MGEPFEYPPATDEVEVSVFGPGYGESVLVHVGHGRWMLVDSCLNDDGMPAALSYLRLIGLDPAAALRLIVVSHWHDDHTAGIAEAIESAPAAYVALPDALLQREFTTLLAVDDERRTALSGTSEIVRVFGQVNRLARERRLLWGIADRPLWVDNADVPTATITALSPSDAANLRAKQSFERLQPVPGKSLRGVPNPEPNEAALALHVSVGNCVVVLGGDLEETAPTRGWSTILANPRRPQAHGSLFKVPHHGSWTGQHDAIWTDLLTPDPVAIVAPFFYGAHTIPNIQERRHIRSKAATAYITSAQRPRGGRRAVQSRERAVQRTISESTLSFRGIAGGVGHVQARRPAAGSGPWSVRLGRAACALPDKWR